MRKIMLLLALMPGIALAQGGLKPAPQGSVAAPPPAATPATPAAPAAPGAAVSPAAMAQLRAHIQRAVGPRWLSDNIFTGDFTGDGQPDAVVFIYSTGQGNSFDLQVALFQGAGGGFRFLRNADDVFGTEPRQPAFRPGQFQVTTTMPRPGDARCCPTGERRWTVRVAGGTPAAQAPAAQLPGGRITKP
jgi:hypothetical protein